MLFLSALLGLSGCGEPAATRPAPVDEAAAKGKAAGPAPSARPVVIPRH